MEFSVNLTKRIRQRKLKSGATIAQTRYVLNYREPKSGARRQEFFEHQKAAQARRSELILRVANGNHFDERKVPTVSAAIDHWLENKAGNVKASTLGGHKVVVAHIRSRLGKVKISDLTTAQIRLWHREVTEKAGGYTANRAKSLLKSILALAEEDFNVRSPSMPIGIGRGHSKTKKSILTPDLIAKVIEAAKADPERGVYYAFPFLVGTRPSEQLGLLWEDVDFDTNVVRIKRIQERDGSLCEMTKTAAGTREVPIGPTLREMLLAWRVRCPRLRGELHRVFPGLGRLTQWPKPRVGGGGPLLYQNWRRRFWAPVFKKLGLPYVTPHSARHSFISTMQAQGVEVGLVAKLAGHANAVVTLQHYTQAVRGGSDAVLALEKGYEASNLGHRQGDMS